MKWAFNNVYIKEIIDTNIFLVLVDVGFGNTSMQYLHLGGGETPSLNNPINAHEALHARVVRNFLKRVTVGCKCSVVTDKETHSQRSIKAGRAIYPATFNLQIKADNILYPENCKGGKPITLDLLTLMNSRGLLKKTYTGDIKYLTGILYQLEDRCMNRLTMNEIDVLKGNHKELNTINN